MVFVNNTNLHEALRDPTCNIKDIKRLIDSGIDINVRDELGNTPLSFIVTFRHCSTDVVNQLLESGAEIDAVDDMGITPLHKAMAFVHKHSYKGDVIRLLLERGAAIHLKSGESPLHYALRYGNTNTDVIRLLIDRGAAIDAVDQRGCSPLQTALKQSCNADVIKLLLDRGGNIQFKAPGGLSPLYYAVLNKSNDTEVIRLLLKRGAVIADVDSWGHSPLHVALIKMSCSRQVIKLLLDFKADINAKSEAGKSSLHYAAHNKSITTDVISLLLSRGAAINAIAYTDKVPLSYAVDSCLQDIVKLLLEKGALIDLGKGPIPLLRAINLNNRKPSDQSFECAQLVMKYAFFQGIDVERLIANMRVNGKLTLFTHACAREFHQMNSEILTVGITLCQFLRRQLKLQSHEACNLKGNGECVYNTGLYILTDIIHKYPIYRDMILAILMTPNLIKCVLLEQPIYTESRLFNQDVTNRTVLDIDSVYSVMKLLSREDFLNLILAFHTNNRHVPTFVQSNFSLNKRKKMF